MISYSICERSNVYLFVFSYNFLFLETNKENLKPRTQGFQCCYFNCKNRSYTKDGQRTNFHFFKVPLASPAKNVWCNRMGKMEGKDGFVLTQNTKVCNEHFKREDVLKVPGGKRWRLKDGVAPLKAGQPCPDTRRRKPPTTRHECHPKKKLKIADSPVLVDAINAANQPKTLVSCALLVVNQMFNVAKKKSKEMNDHINNIEKELNDTKIKLEKSTKKEFGINIIKENNELCQHYTGFTDFERLKTCQIYLSVGEKGENVRMRGSTEKKGSGRPRLLSAEDQFFLLLIKLRCGFSNTHLGWLFNCDNATVTRIIISWLNYVFLKFCTLPIWPSREEVNKSMPDMFKKKYPDTRIIVDCTEIAVEAPESLHTRSVYYSDYKHHNTYKALIGITPAGGLSFVSELFPGSVSDREIFSRSGILNQKFWDKGDEIMADKGFNIRDLLDQIGVKLNIPIFLEDRAQFTADQVIVNQGISSLRIHVERYISRIKNFHIFDRPLPLTMHGSANQIFTTCAFLVMFQNPIISVS